MNIHILEMPLDFGGNRHGSDMGPSAIRLAGLKNTLLRLGHTVEKKFSLSGILSQEYENEGDPKARYLAPIVRSCTQLAEQVYQTIKEDSFPLIIGGDHSIALGTFAGLSAGFKEKGKKLGVLYVDAHGDFNTPKTSPSGNIHGMCVSASCGYGIPELTNLYFAGQKIDPKNVCYLGLRDLDPKEKLLMHEAGVKAITMTQIDRLGFTNAVKEAINFLQEAADVIHISVDMDVMDPMYAPGVGIPLAGGLSYREILLLMEEVYQTKMLCSAEIVEVNPVLDVRNQTAKMAVEIIARLLGDTIF
ncbi:MAG: arginase [Treponemataceae bacterium]